MGEDGPIGLITAPTRELVKQIAFEATMFCKHLGYRCVAAFGGGPLGTFSNSKFDDIFL